MTTADRPSRELRVVTSESGSVRLETVTDPPGAAAPAAPRPPRPSSPPGRVATWAPLVVALVGAGGLPAACEYLRGDGGVGALAAEVRLERAETRAQVSRLAEAVDKLTARQEAEDAVLRQQQRERDERVGSYLRQRPPDPKGALDAMREER